MAKYLSESLALLAVVCFSTLLLGARADIDVEAPEVQSSAYPIFPYCRCTNGTSAYSLAPQVTFKGNNTYCFTLRVRSCTASCCKVNLKKIEFDINTKCAVKSATIRATLNGVPTTTGPAIYFPADGPTGSTVLRLTDLPLGLSDNGAEVCLTLLPSRTGAGCTTLQDLCKTPADKPAGVCRTALFNSNNSTNSCCPQSDTNFPYPPPSPLPPSPLPPSPLPPSPLPPSPLPPSPSPPPPPCSQCLTVRLVPPSVNDFPPFRFDAALCAAVQASLSARLNAVVAGSAPQSLLVSFAPGPNPCTGLAATVCGTFASVAEAEAVQDQLQTELGLFATEVQYNVCSTNYGVRIDSTPGSCMKIVSDYKCDPRPNPFPKCQCKKIRNVSPLYVRPNITVLYGGNTTLYCFTIDAVPRSSILPGYKCGNTLSKIEIWADDSRRRKVTGFRVTPAGGSPSYKSVSWGDVGENTLKVTPLNWSFSQAVGGQVCMELVKNYSIKDFCLGGGSCYLSLFDSILGKGCCPAYWTLTNPIVP